MTTVYLSPLAGAGSQFFDNNGVPLSGGLLYTYTAGTTTPQTTYTTNAGTIANSNPIQLNAFGRLDNEVWLTQGVSYKLVLKDSGGSTIGTYDNISGINDVSGQITAIYAALAAPTGSNLIGFIQAGTNAVARTAQSKMREWFSVKDFGATGDGVTDDTAAIQNAFTAANGTKSVFIPDGSYVVTTSIDCKGSEVFGQSMYGSKILCHLSNARAFTNLGRNIDSLSFIGTGYATADAFEIGGYLHYINNCYFYQLRDSICPTNIIVTSTVNQCLFLGCYSAINDKLHDGTSAHTTLWFTSNSVQYGTNAFVMKTEAAGMYFSGNVFEQLEKLYWSPSGAQLFASVFIKNWIEQVYTNLTIFSNIFAGSNNTCIENDIRPGAMTITDGDKMGSGQFALGGNANGGGGGARMTTGGIRLCNFNASEGQVINYAGVLPAAATANFSAASNYTVATQAANANQTSLGGDFVVDTGAGSNGQRKGAFRPKADNDTQVGDASYRWSVIYAATGTINTSDVNEKEQIVDLSDAEKAAAAAVKSQLKRFKFKDAVQKKGDSARYHFGAIAQQVEQAFKDNGLNPEHYGVFCRDVWYTIVDDKNETVRAYPDAQGKYPENAVRHERLGIRYDELFAFVLASI